MAGPVIAVAFDGVGLGTDGTAWGGEFLIADLAGFVRAAHLSEVAMRGRGRCGPPAVADGRRSPRRSVRGSAA